MTTKDLASLLERGLGRVVFLLENRYTPEFRDTILHACLHDVGYGAPFEGSRAPYMMDVIHATGEPHFYEDAVCNALDNPLLEYDHNQMIGLACRMARLGNERAREVAYRAVERRFSIGKYYEADDIIHMDGLTGYAAVVSLYVRYPPPEDTPDYFPDDLFLRDLEEQFGEAGVRPAILQVIALHPELAEHCLPALEQWEAEKARQAARSDDREPLPPLTYDAARDKMAQHPEWRSFPYGGLLTPEAAEHLAQEALDSTDALEKTRLLSLFRDRDFPLSIEPLLPLAYDPDERLRGMAVRVLSRLQHPALRPLYRELAKISGREDDALRLLIRNGISTDIRRILPLAEDTPDMDTLHSFGMVLLRFFKEHPDPGVIPALLYLYKRGPCTFCRHGIIECLRELNAVPAWLLKECRYDAFPETRELAAEIERGEFSTEND